MSLESLKEYDYHTVVCCGNCKCFNKEMYMGDSGFCEVHQPLRDMYVGRDAIGVRDNGIHTLLVHKEQYLYI